MDTLEEWEFINEIIENRTVKPYNEWHIGLLQNRTIGDWTWINGKPLTFDKWQRGEPRKTDSFVLMAKEWPPGSYGSFNSIKKTIHSGDGFARNKQEMKEPYLTKHLIGLTSNSFRFRRMQRHLYASVSSVTNHSSLKYHKKRFSTKHNITFNNSLSPAFTR